MTIQSLQLGETRFDRRVITPPATGSLRRLRKWGDPVMKAWGYDVQQVGVSNWQNIALWNSFTGYGAITNYLWIEREWIDYLRSLQFDGYNGIGEYHDQDSKMNWLCRDKGAMYLDAGGWKDATMIKWGTTAVGGNAVAVEEYAIQRAEDKSTGRVVDLLMANVRCFRKADQGRELDDLLASGLVHRCYCVYMPDNGFGDSPKGIVYSPMWSPLDWDFGGARQPESFWIPEVLLETE